MHSLNSFIHTALLQQSRYLQQLTRNLYSILPPQFIGHCQVSQLDNNNLTITADSSTWATHLRFQKPAIAKHFGKITNQNIYKIIIRIDPILTKNASTAKNLPPLSNTSATQLQSLATTLDDSSLKQSILKLAKRAES